MRYLPILLIVISMASCSRAARRSFLGNWEEVPSINIYATQDRRTFGYFTLVQHQKYWADKLDAAELELMFTNTTSTAVSFNFQINFQLFAYHPRHIPENRGVRNPGYWTYSNAVVVAQPNETVHFGLISDRVASIKDGRIYVRITSPIILER